MLSAAKNRTRFGGAHDDTLIMRGAAAATVNGIAALKAKDLKVRSLQHHFRTYPKSAPEELPI